MTAVKTPEKKNESGQYAVFLIGDQLCALSIEEVVEIIRLQPITEVPGVKHFISGMINLRGNIIPVIHLRKRYDLEEIPFHKKTRIVVIHHQGENIGLIVDEVIMVTHVDLENVEPPLEMFNSLEKDCFQGFAKIKNQLIGILNLEKVLYPDDAKEG